MKFQIKLYRRNSSGNFICFALLNFYFAFISSLLCFYINRNVFLTNIRHVLWVLKRTISLRRFFWVPTANVFGWELKWRKWLSNARFYLEVLFFAPYLGFSLSPKSLETSHHGGQGLFEPRLSHLFEFRNLFPLDRYMLITCNFKNRKLSVFWNFLSL